MEAVKARYANRGRNSKALTAEELRSAAEGIRTTRMAVSSETMATALGYRNSRTFQATLHRAPQLKAVYRNLDPIDRLRSYPTKPRKHRL